MGFRSVLKAMKSLSSKSSTLSSHASVSVCTWNVAFAAARASVYLCFSLYVNREVQYWHDSEKAVEESEPAICQKRDSVQPG